MKSQFSLISAGLIISSLATFATFASETRNQDEELARLQRSLADKQATTAALEQEKAKKKEIQNLEKQIAEEDEKQEKLTHEIDSQPETKPAEKELHGGKRVEKNIKNETKKLGKKLGL